MRSPLNLDERLRAVSLVFKIIGVLSLAATVLLLLPAPVLQKLIARAFSFPGGGSAPLAPICVYSLRWTAGLLAGIGLMSLIAAREPARHQQFARVVVGTLVLLGILSVTAGLEAGVATTFFVMKSLVLWVGAVAIVLLWPWRTD